MNLVNIWRKPAQTRQKITHWEGPVDEPSSWHTVPDWKGGSVPAPTTWDQAARDEGTSSHQVPDVREELLLLSAATLQRWSSATEELASQVGRILAAPALQGQDAAIAPARGPLRNPRLCSTLASSGIVVLRSATCLSRSPEEIASFLRVAATAGKAPPVEGTWHDGWYRRDYTALKTVLDNTQRIQRDRAGRLNINSLLASPILGSDLLLNREGRVLSAGDLPGLSIGDATVGQFIEFKWQASTVLCFRRRQGSYPDPGDRSFRVLCDLLVMCYPELLIPHHPPETLHERSRSPDKWRLIHRHGSTVLQREMTTGTFADVATVKTLHQAEATARAACGRHRLQFQPHPSLSPVLPLWGSATRLSKKELRRLLAEPRHARAEVELAARTARAHEASEAFGTALEEVSWKDIHALPHSTSRQRLTLHKIKSQRLPGWDGFHNRRGCPHCPELGPGGGTTFHIIWQCPAAQKIWDIVKTWWKRLGLWTGPGSSPERSFFQAIFRLRLPQTPSKVWEFASLHQGHRKTDDPAADPFPVLQEVWRQIVLESLVFLQAWRTKSADDAKLWSLNHAKVLHDANCQAALRVLRTRLAADPSSTPAEAILVGELRTTFCTKLIVPPAAHLTGPSAQAHTHLLFLDGGSSGASQTSAAGAVLIRAAKASGEATIIWATSAVLTAAGATSHQAAYKGLAAGLQAARERNITQLEVLSHSTALIRQLRDHRPPRPTALRNLFLHARKLADLVEVSAWTLHPRAHNKMAGQLVKLGLTSGTATHAITLSSQADTADLAKLLHNDLSPWWTSPRHLVEAP